MHGGGARGAAGAGGAGQGGADAPGVPVRLPGRDHPTGGGGEPRSLRLYSAAAGGGRAAGGRACALLGCTGDELGLRGRYAAGGLLPFGSDGWFRPDAGLTWRDFSGVLDKLAQTEAGRAAFPVLAAAWSEKTLAAAEADEDAAEAVLTRAELARALNSLLGRCPDGQDAQLQAAAWYRDNQDQTAWYYADLIEASVDHTCRLLPQGEQWTAIG